MIQKLVTTLLQTKAHTVTKYVSPKEIIRATRRIYGGKVNGKQVEIFLTIGKPNYKERAFIKDCLKAGEKFPIKKIQLKFPPKK